MKLRNKILIITFFFGIVIFYNSNCYGANDTLTFIHDSISYTVNMPNWSENLEIQTKNGYSTQSYHFFIAYDKFTSQVRLYVPILPSKCFDTDNTKTVYDITKMYIKIYYSNSDPLYATYVFNTTNNKYEYVSNVYWPYLYDFKFNLWTNPWNDYSFINASEKGAYIIMLSDTSSLVKYSTLIINDPNGIVLVEGTGAQIPVSVFKTVTLYIDDQNFRKRFKFQLNIPLPYLDTKYYIFLSQYTRQDYDNVTAVFYIYTVSTPQDYDYSNYQNYLYYNDYGQSDTETGTIQLPAGCRITEYVTTAQNGTVAELETLNEEYVAERKEWVTYEDFKNMTGITQITNTGCLTYNFLNITLGQSAPTSYSLDYLFPTDFYIKGFNQLSSLYKLMDGLGFTADKLSLSTIMNFLGYNSFEQGLYYMVTNILYYGPKLPFKFDDFICGSASIISYENTRTSNNRTETFYNLYRKTKVYNQENKLYDNCYSFQYIDGQDVTGMLPEGTDYGYLTSPFYKENENSSSGGNIFYDVLELTKTDTFIDYSKDDNSIHNTFNGDYIENFEEGDKITINNYYTDVIDKTSDEHLLHNIYTTLLDIKSILSSMNDSLMDTTNNFSYNFEQNIDYWFSVNTFQLDYTAKQISNTAKNHLGIIYNPFEFLIYTVTLFSRMDNTTEIVLDIPEVSYNNHILISETHFSFTDYMNDLPILKTIHMTYLTAVDFVLLGLLVKLAIKMWKEVFDS